MKKLAIFSAVIAAVALGFYGLRVLYSAQVKEAQRFCEGVIPKLEASRAQTGNYPTNLDATVFDSRQFPTLLRGSAFYKSDGIQYSFTFRESLAWDNIWTYTSSGKRWVDYD